VTGEKGSSDRGSLEAVGCIFCGVEGIQRKGKASDWKGKRKVGKMKEESRSQGKA